MYQRREKFLRRVVTVPLFSAAFVLGLALLPVLLPITLVIDLVRRTPLALSRALLFVVHYLGCETAGIVAGFGLWARAKLTGTTSGEKWLADHYRLQSWWASSLLNGARLFFGLRLEVKGADAAPEISGPFLLFLRHLSFGDTVLAAVYLSARYGHRLRYVLKRELLWDPCLDIVGHRIPNYFVHRGAETMSRELEEIRALSRNLAANEGVLIYPEGTRFTPARRRALLRRFEEKGDQLSVERTRVLHNVLLPRRGGALALLEECPDADVVICAHVGFEGTMRASDLLSGKLVGTVVRVAFWRIPARSIPRDEGARMDWLFERWQEIDVWVAAEGRAAPPVFAAPAQRSIA